MTRRVPLIDDQTGFWEGIFVALLKTIVSGWIFTIMVGWIHGDWITQLPTVGYWAGVGVVGAACGVIYCLKPSSD